MVLLHKSLSCWKCKLILRFVLLFGLGLKANLAAAQVIGDPTLPAGENTVVTPANGVYEITGGAIRGSNLFHSFDQMSISDREEAFFNHGDNVTTILGRVTGILPSNIDGKIRAVRGSTADIFLINPQGITFGPNASLDIGGSFIASSADRIIFANDAEFSATNPQPVSLTVSQPLGLVLGDSAGSIVNESNIEDVGLKVSPGETIALVGNEINLTGGGLAAPSGRIELASLAPGSSVTLVPPSSADNSGWMLDYGNTDNPSFRNIQLTAGALVTVNGTPSGSIRLRGRQISLAKGSLVVAINRGISEGGELSVFASEQLTLSDGSIIGTTTFGTGNGGNLLINVFGDVELLGASGLAAEAGESVMSATGAAGNLSLNAANLRVYGGSFISTSTIGDAAGGRLLVNTPGGSIEIDGVLSDDPNNPKRDDRASALSSITQGVQDAGDIQINTQSLSVQNGGQIQSGTFGSGNGGRTRINATDSVTVSGELGVFPSRISSVNCGDNTANCGGNGDNTAGSVEITTGRLEVRDGGTIFTSTNSPGQGGILIVHSDDVILSGEGRVNRSGLYARTLSSGDSGRLTFSADTLLIEDNALITVSAAGSTTNDVNISPENFGIVRDADIDVRIITLNNGQIKAESPSGNGGNLIFTVQDYILLRNGSLISATAGIAQTRGDGGNIEIDAPNGFIIAVPNEDSDIIANAYIGRGGNIDIEAQGIYGLVNRPATRGNGVSEIDARSQFGTSGTVTLNNLAVDPTQGLLELPESTADAAPIAQRCLADSEGQNAFVVTGRGGIAPNPEAVVRNETGNLADLGAGAASSDTIPPITQQPTTEAPIDLAPEPLIEAQGWQRDADGNVVLIASAETHTDSPIGQPEAACPS